jgi:hypothetical protein
MARAWQRSVHLKSLAFLLWSACGDNLDEPGRGGPEEASQHDAAPANFDERWAEGEWADSAEGAVGMDSRPSPGADAEGETYAVEARGACLSEADRTVIEASSVPRLSCEGAACVAQHLRIGLPASIDEEATRTCVGSEAPTLRKLSPGCQACFVAISLCVPRACVKLLGGPSDACISDVPSAAFSACEEPPQASSACAECQETNCEDAFVACSGFSRTR